MKPFTTATFFDAFEDLALIGTDYKAFTMDGFGFKTLLPPFYWGIIDL